MNKRIKKLFPKKLFYQAMAYVMLPIMLLLFFYFYFDYRGQKKNLEENARKENSLLINQIVSSLLLMDEASYSAEQYNNFKLRNATKIILENYKNNFNTLKNGNLKDLILQSNLDTNEFDIYFFDETLKSINTSSNNKTPYEIGKNSLEFKLKFNFLIKQDSFFVDRTAYSELLRIPKKYSYSTTPDHKHLLEFAIDPKEEQNILENFNTYISNLDNDKSYIKDIKIYFGSKDYQQLGSNEPILENHKEAFNMAFKDGYSSILTETKDEFETNYEYIPLPMKGAKCVSGWILMLKSDNKYLIDLKANIFKHFLFSSLITLLLVGLIVLIASLYFSTAINELISRFEKIEKGDLESMIYVSDRNELGLLAYQINRTTNILKVNKNSLEDKIAKRTFELKETNKKLEKEKIQKDILLKEIHHRVKNNLQIISSIINLEANRESAPTISTLNDIQARIRSIATIHELMYEGEKENKLDTKSYLTKLTNNTIEEYASKNNIVNVNFDLTSIELNIKNLLPLAIILNELLTNSFKYAFIEIKNPLIKISLFQKQEQLTFSYEDNGIGFNEELIKKDSFGLSLIKIFADQLNTSILKDKTRIGVKYIMQIKLGSIN